MAELSRRHFAALTDPTGSELGNAGPVSRRRRERPPYDHPVLGAALGFIAKQRKHGSSSPPMKPQPFEVTEAKRAARKEAREKGARKPPPRWPKRSKPLQGVSR